MKKNTTNTVRFTVDFIEKKIIGTKASFDKASKGFGPAYEELAEKVAKHSDFKLEVKEQKKHTTKAKRTYDGMDFAFMEAYIETLKNAEQIMAEYEAIKADAKKWDISVYPYTKKWFLGEFDPDKNGFDMAKAKQEITEYRMSRAILNAEPVERGNEQIAAD
ncbi:MAG: hypothetical protein E7445_04975 [Ruminococcaceae bacterium]|nr:hypothetical protein [Oscillospiraceae bacterium]